MKNSIQAGKHGAVIAIYERQNISQEPEIKTLIEVNREMTEKERIRTEQYLKEKDSNEKIVKEVIR